MTGAAGGTGLIVSFPAAGAGGTTLEQLEKLTARRGLAYLAMPNPASVDELESGGWLTGCLDQIGRAMDQQSAVRVLLVGHCMGGLSAIRLSDELSARLDLPVAALVINTPCPDPSGRIPTMSRFCDAEIAEVLAHEGFPQELLDDEDMLAEIADGLRNDAVVADRIAEWVNSAEDLDTLHVLATRGDRFIPAEHCAAWRGRVSREFHLMIVEGGHALDESSIGALERAVDSVLACAHAEVR